MGVAVQLHSPNGTAFAFHAHAAPRMQLPPYYYINFCNDKLWCVHTIKRNSKLILIVTPIMCKQLDDILHATNALKLVPVHYTVCRACPSVFPCYSHYLLAQLVLHCLGVYYRYHSWARTTNQFKSSEVMLAKPSHLVEEILAGNLPDLNVSMWLTVTMKLNISLLVY